MQTTGKQTNSAAHLARSKKLRMRNYKTLFLAILTISLFAGVCVWSFEIPSATVLSYLWISAILIFAIMATALCCITVFAMIKKLSSK